MFACTCIYARMYVCMYARMYVNHSHTFFIVFQLIETKNTSIILVQYNSWETTGIENPKGNKSRLVGSPLQHCCNRVADRIIFLFCNLFILNKVCMCALMYVCMTCKYVCMYVCLSECMHVYLSACMYVCM